MRWRNEIRVVLRYPEYFFQDIDFNYRNFNVAITSSTLFHLDMKNNLGGEIKFEVKMSMQM